MLSISAVGASLRMPSVPSIGPGEIPFTRIPIEPHSSARHFTSMLIPAFAAQACACIIIGFSACGAVMATNDEPLLVMRS